MNLIAIEPSTRIHSITLAREKRVVATVSWDESQVERQYLFEALPKLLQDNTIAFEDVDRFVIGSGPGSFSGIRIAIAACQGLAQPSGAKVSCIPSADVTAHRFDTADRPILVVGDARRKKLWCAEYVRQDGVLTVRKAAHLIDITALGDYVTPETTVVSPDYERIAETLSALTPTGARIVAAPVVPSAGDLAALAFERLDRGDPLAPPVPTYLHPAVFVEPRFPVTQLEGA